MKKAEAIAMIDAHKNGLIHPVDLLNWTWMRVIINQISDDEWDLATVRAEEIMSK